MLLANDPVLISQTRKVNNKLKLWRKVIESNELKINKFNEVQLLELHGVYC